MATPVRYPSGVSTQEVGNPLANYGNPDPTKWHSYFEDFDYYAAGDWTITAVGTGTSALGDVDNGVLVVTASAADNDGRQHQKVGESFLLTAGKKTIFKARFKVSDATQSDLAIGLIVTDTTILGATAGDGATDGVFFQKDDGSTSLIAYCQKDTTTGQVSGTAGTLANDTFVTVAWEYDGKSKVSYWFNDVKAGELAATSATLPDTELTVSFALLNGEAVAKALTVDYVFAAQER